MTNNENEVTSAPSASDQKPLTFLEMVQSTLWALLGVQKPDNHSRDFSQGNPWHFIYMGIGFTVIFVLVLVGIVHLSLNALN